MSVPLAHGKRQQEGRMPIQIKERTDEQRWGLFSLLSTIRWEAQFKLAKCCMRASTAISDLGVFLAEPVLKRSRASVVGRGHGVSGLARYSGDTLTPISGSAGSFCPILFRLPLDCWHQRVLNFSPVRRAAGHRRQRGLSWNMSSNFAIAVSQWADER